jgi:acyl CoA:acetate/3-ketoacid CoA transferase beta subunit
MADDLRYRTYIAAIARELRDGERVHVGANQNDVAVAVQLARRLWAPRLMANIAGSWVQSDPADTALLGRSAYENVTVMTRRSNFSQARVFDDLLRAPIVFAGGLQVDRRGNANLIGVRQRGRLVVRGPGSAGLPTLTSFAPRFYIVCPLHEPRVLVDEVSEVSVLGDPEGRARVGLDPAALRAVITPLARFEPSSAGLVLTELAAGVDLDQVAASTGFEIVASPSVSERTPLSALELKAIDELQRAALAHASRGPA